MSMDVTTIGYCLLAFISEEISSMSLRTFSVISKQCLLCYRVFTDHLYSQAFLVKSLLRGIEVALVKFASVEVETEAVCRYAARSGAEVSVEYLLPPRKNSGISKHKGRRVSESGESCHRFCCHI